MATAALVMNWARGPKRYASWWPISSAAARAKQSDEARIPDTAFTGLTAEALQQYSIQNTQPQKLGIQLLDGCIETDICSLSREWRVNWTRTQAIAADLVTRWELKAALFS